MTMLISNRYQLTVKSKSESTINFFQITING